MEISLLSLQLLFSASVLRHQYLCITLFVYLCYEIFCDV